MGSLIIKNALLYNRKKNADVFVRDGVVEQIGVGISEKADAELDVEGKLLMPGVIDPHVHFRVPGQEHKEDFVSGSTAALLGGVTTVGDMPNTDPAVTTVKQLEEKMARAKKEGRVEIGCYIGATTDNVEEVKAADGKAFGVKVAPYFTGADGKKIIDDDAALEKLFSLGLNMPIVIHCEDESMVGKNAVKLKGYTGADIHSKLRSPEVALSAMKRVLTLAAKTKAKIHITHISTKKELSLIVKAKKDGIDVTCDVTPHHLTFTDLDVEERGHYMKVNPPLRSGSDVEALWKGLVKGDIDMVATDHAPHLWEEKNQESYWDVPSGLPGLDTSLLVMLNQIDDERFLMDQLVQVMCTAPAERFGLKGKGAIKQGSVADMVVVDLHSPTVIVREQLKTKCGWSPWQGHMFRATIANVIRGGELITD